MRGRVAKVAVLGVVLGLVGQGAAAGTVTGTVTYVGKVPKLKPLSVAAEPICAKAHATVPNEVLVLGSGNTLANIIVKVAKGLPSGKTWPAHAWPSARSLWQLPSSPQKPARAPSSWLEQSVTQPSGWHRPGRQSV